MTDTARALDGCCPQCGANHPLSLCPHICRMNVLGTRWTICGADSDGPCMCDVVVVARDPDQLPDDQEDRMKRRPIFAIKTTARAWSEEDAQRDALARAWSRGLLAEREGL